MSQSNEFNTNQDRLARDIRNQLGRKFVSQLAADLDLAPVEKLAGDFLSKKPGTIYENYIRERIKRFQDAKEQIKRDNVKDDFFRSLILWDHLLFFETHEILEDLWMKAEGNHKLILQALIRAAGVYIHLGNRNFKGAEKMATKARKILIDLKDEIPAFPGLDSLIQKLSVLDGIPPKLLS